MFNFVNQTFTNVTSFIEFVTPAIAWACTVIWLVLTALLVALVVTFPLVLLDVYLGHNPFKNDNESGVLIDATSYLVFWVMVIVLIFC